MRTRHCPTCGTRLVVETPHGAIPWLVCPECEAAMSNHAVKCECGEWFIGVDAYVDHRLDGECNADD